MIVSTKALLVSGPTNSSQTFCGPFQFGSALNERTNGRMDEWTNERMDEWTNERTNEWTNGRCCSSLQQNEDSKLFSRNLKFEKVCLSAQKYCRRRNTYLAFVVRNVWIGNLFKCVLYFLLPRNIGFFDAWNIATYCSCWTRLIRYLKTAFLTKKFHLKQESWKG